MAPNKQIITHRDLLREADRHGVNIVWNSKHPVRSVEAMRLLTAIDNNEKRIAVAERLYKAYWQEDKDVSSTDFLTSVMKEFNISLSEQAKEAAKKKLKDNTTWASSNGAFGVPTFFIIDNKGDIVGERFYFGQDRMFFLASEISKIKGRPQSDLCLPHRVPSNKDVTASSKQGKQLIIQFYHDFASPWSYIGSTQIESVAKKYSAKIIYRPILLGALFKQIGTPNVPMLAISEAKRAYGGIDMSDWTKFWGIDNVRFPEAFPIRTVLPLRVSLVNPKTINSIYRAAWRDGLDIGNEKVLHDVLINNGFADAADIISKANSDPSVKNTLKENTEKAYRIGLCGVPSITVHAEGTSDENCENVWGQDRFNVVEDMLSGSYPTNRLEKAKL